VKRLKKQIWFPLGLGLIFYLFFFGASFPIAAGASPEQELEKALTLYKDKEYAQALQTLQRLAKDYPSHPCQADGLFLQGLILHLNKQWAEAAQVFSQAAEIHPTLQDYALYYQGESLGMAKEEKKGLETYQRLINLYPKSLMVFRAELKIAEIYLRRGEYARSAEISVNLLQRAPREDYGAQALFFLGQAKEGLSLWASAIQTYQEIWLKYPLHFLAHRAKEKWLALAKEKKITVEKISPVALFRRMFHFYRARLYEIALQEMENMAGFPRKAYPRNYAGESWIDELYYYRGMCHFYLKQYPQAVEAFNLVIRRSRNEAVADRSIYWLMRSLYRQGRKEEALHTFSLLQNTYPRSPFFDRALYLRAQIFDDRGIIAEAAALYQEVVDRFPQSSLRFQSLWQAGWLLFKAQDLKGAIQVWERLKSLHPNSPWLEKVFYWQGRALEIMGLGPEAEENFRKLRHNYPSSYYSQLAVTRGRSFLTHKGFSASLAEQGLNSFLNEKTQPSPSGHMEKGRDLIRLGLLSLAVEELEAAEEEGKKIEEIPKEISRLYRDAGEYYRSALLVRRNFSLKPMGKQPEGKDRALYILAYPLGNYLGIKHYAQNRNLDPALLCAVILEESRFNPQALSVSGARGLMQILPGTGQQIAKRLKIQLANEGNLFDPEINLRLGSWFLSSLLEEFAGKEVLAVAAYNAGPHKVRQWLVENPAAREDEFVENIPYEETRNYVIKVLNSAQIYRVLYGAAPNKGGS